MKISLRLTLWPIILFFVIYLGCFQGSITTSINDVISAFWAYDSDNTLHYIILHLRMPRIILSMLTGGALALSGYLMQAMVNNPLADPYLLGTASGATLGVNLAYLGVFPSWLMAVYSTSIFAFVGALAVTLLAVVIAYHRGKINPSRLLLAGIALSSLMVAFTTLLIFIYSSDNKLKKVIFWSMGSFEAASWNDIPLLLAGLFAVGLVFIFFTPHLNILLLGEERANNLGVNIKKLRIGVLVATSLLTSLSVAVAGPIGFVGLMVPHFIRGVFGVHGKFNIPDVIFTGAVFLSLCDIAGKWVTPDSSLPIGVITSFLGIPFFVYLLTKRDFRFN